ncbi:DNA-directed DNA polymerase, family A, palm domain containing protein [uncultured Caudovirales phage]|uniref:DNA-directed DNA polymerase, family A, palm domain containing protein n=1 Tax=uncultured Caudovirales phage TaxID=2100421 RepID=A0A6J5TAY8_9CAUD|nr:DNA-directed DNA polymerase, family A, palm domain containing protein [uncultured Caudovirales phage]
MKPLIFDFETTTFEKGNPYTQRNKLCYGIWTDTNGYSEFADYLNNPYGAHQFDEDMYDTLVGFNLKFDLAWARRYGMDTDKFKLWDCQYAHYLITNQKSPYPSLNEVAEYYGLPSKVDKVKEYWDAGVDTPDIPAEIMEEYTRWDGELTKRVFLAQYDTFKGSSDDKYNLFKVAMEDLRILQKMEETGIQIDQQAIRVKLADNLDQIKVLNDSLLEGYPSFLNLGSNEQLSAYLYGGTVFEKGKEEIGVYKTGIKAGQPKFKNIEIPHHLPRLFTPPRNSEATKEGVFKVGSEVIKRIKPNLKHGWRLDHIKRLTDLTSENSKCLEGIPNIIAEKEWTNNTFHSNLNQCVAATGRLSSTSPNQQNLPPMFKELCPSKNGYYVSVDATALEWYTAVFLSQDKVGIAEIMAGEDIHSANQQALGLPSRLIAKKFMFRLIYGGTEYSYANDPDFEDICNPNDFPLNYDESSGLLCIYDRKLPGSSPVKTYSGNEKESIKLAKDWIKDNTGIGFWKKVIIKTYNKYKGLATWHRALMVEATTTGEVQTPTGRVHEFKPCSFSDGRVDWPRTLILNYPVQGFGADIMSVARVLFSRKWDPLWGDLVSTVHDSIVVDIKEEYLKDVCLAMFETFEKLPHALSKCFNINFNIPLRCEVSYGKNLATTDRELSWKEYQNKSF